MLDRLGTELIKSWNSRQNELHWGYPSKQTDNTPLITALSQVYTKHKSYQKQGLKCLDEDTLNQLLFQINKLTFSCKSTKNSAQEDTSNFENWIKHNPRCVSFESWERYSYILFNAINIDFKVEEKKCNLAFDIASNKIDCNLLTSISVILKDCNLSAQLTAKKEECKLIIDAVSSKHPSCKLDVKTVNKALSCGINSDFIMSVYESNCKLKLTARGLAIETENNTYCLEDFVDQGEIDLNILA